MSGTVLEYSPFFQCPFIVMLTREKMDSPPGPLSVWSLRTLPISVGIFSGDSGFFPHPKGMRVRWMVCLHCPRLSECGWVRVFLRWKSVRSRVGPTWALSCSERFQPPWPWTGIRWKIMTLFLSVFSKCMYSSHLFHCLTFRSALGLYLEVCWCFCDQKCIVGT